MGYWANVLTFILLQLQNLNYLFNLINLFTFLIVHQCALHNPMNHHERKQD